MKSIMLTLFSGLSIFLFFSCGNQSEKNNGAKTTRLNLRQQADTIGFAQYQWQMDSLIARLDAEDKTKTENVYKMAVCPHDDYAYAGGLYAKTLEKRSNFTTSIKSRSNYLK